MYYSIVALFIVSQCICSLIVHLKWRGYANDRFWGVEMLRMHNALSRVWPCDDHFASLHFSMIRHTLVALVSSLVIWCVNIAVLNSVLLLLNALYVVLPLMRYRVRSADYRTSGEASQKLLSGARIASLVSLVAAILNYVILLLCYGLRP